MPELGPYGSVRGALGNGCPYRDSTQIANIALLVSLEQGIFQH